ADRHAGRVRQHVRRRARSGPFRRRLTRGVAMIFAFDRPHREGSVCRFPCSQCGETANEPGTFSGRDASPVTAVQAPPLFIIRKATRQEWIEYAIASNAEGALECDAPYFYEVSAD